MSVGHDTVAERAIDFLAGRDGEGATVREIAEAIGANPSTLGNALRGASAGDRPTFERCSHLDDLPGRPALWRLRAHEDEALEALEAFEAWALCHASIESWAAAWAGVEDALREARSERERLAVPG